ncbi:type VI secretion system Vgr family protein [Spirosoma sp. KNUC1025]|uniref:type VI secretion system Vgr family protein n=1 Tax=Spirosoma sp. KNUC1025 TaxID=2894082 RepID=UPI0038664B45|nr:phage baseplate assembly protein V [Spirosoma sp. KNUC1025]
MAKQVITHVELEGGKELKNVSSLSIEQDLFGHHQFDFSVPFEDLEDANELFFHESHRNVIGKTIQFSFEPLLEDGSFDFKFKGIITELTLKNTSDTSNIFLLKGYGLTILLEDSKARRTYLQSSLEDIVNKVLNPYPSNLLKRSVKPKLTDPLKYVVQYDETNFEFLARLSAEYGEWCFYDGQKLVFGKPDDNKVDFNVNGNQTFAMSMRLLPAKFQYSRYDYVADRTYESHSKDQQVNGLGQWGDFTLDESEKLFSQESQLPLPKLVYGQSELDAVAKTQKAMESSRLVDFQGFGENPDVSVGTVISVKGTRITERGTSDENFGNYRITHVSHSVDGSGNYANTFRAVPDTVTYPPPNPSFRLPIGLSELATVVDNEDPDKLGRIKVEFMWPGDDKESDWLRVAHPYTANGEGMLFVPEVDAQVMIAYESNLAEYPYVLTSLYPKKSGTNYTQRNNVQKLIQTKGGNQISIYDKDGDQKIELTNTNNTDTHVVLSFASDGKITIETKGEIAISGKDVHVKADNNLTLEARNNVEIKATNEVKIEGTASVDVKGAQVKVEADATADIKANAQLSLQGTQTSLKGDAMVEVKGGVIMLN